MTANLIAELEALRKKTARFRRVALHIHSPDSYDWAQGDCDRAKNNKERFGHDAGAAAFAAELRPHFNLVAITDHMRCGLACKVSQAARDSGDLVVLPGMEVNFRPEAALGCSRIHLVVILPEGSTLESFAKLFAGLASIPNEAERTGQEEVSGISLREWVERVHAEQGICIAAHVDRDQGVRLLFRQTAVGTLKLFALSPKNELEQENDVPQAIKDYLFESRLDAIEVSKPTDAPHYRWVDGVNGQRRWIPTVLTSDAHCVEKLADPSRITHIKMTSLGLEGLKSALRFPDTRIRFPSTLPTVPSPVLLGIKIAGTQDSFFEDLTVSFSENLNCLIGVRGSGKSTVVESLRYLFGYNRTLKELDDLAKTVGEMQSANLVGSRIQVLYRTTKSETRLLEATYDKKENYVTKVYSEQGDRLDVSDVELCGEFPLRLFGWSEIEILGREAAKQRDLLDRLVPELKSLLQKREQLRQRLSQSKDAVVKAIGEAHAAFHKNGDVIQHYREYKGDFDRLNTPEVKAIFSALDLHREKRAVLTHIRAQAKALLDHLGSPPSVELLAGLQDLLTKASEELRQWWLASALLSKDVPAAEGQIRDYLNHVGLAIAAFMTRLDQDVEQLDAGIASLEKQLRERMAADSTMLQAADLRVNAEKRLKKATEVRDAYLKTWAALEGALVEQEQLGKALVLAQQEIAQMRQTRNQFVEHTLNRFLPADMKVSIQFTASGDKSAFADKLTTWVAAAKKHRARNLKELVAGKTTPPELCAMLRNENLSSLVGVTHMVDGKTVALASEDVQAIIDGQRPFGKDEAADVSTLSEGGQRLTSLLDLECVPWDDHEMILLNGSPVSKKSPGQRSSAMLPLIALAEETPLVIDQPEDNLDKRLIGNVLVKVLAELKEKRQIIVCTHDPNILVGGDAEQVVVLEATSDRKAKVVDHGSIDDPGIIKTVIDLLEGGAEAFEVRRKRYGM